MKDLLSYVNEYALILIPVLYILGMILKGIGSFTDKYIPVMLLIFGILGAVCMNGISVDSVLQGILVTGVTVYTNQTIKQYKKDE